MMKFLHRAYMMNSRKKEMDFFKKKITKNFKDLEVHRKLTNEQKREVQEFYKSMIGREVDLYCHEYFYSRTGVFTKDYVPNNLYHCEILPRANMHPFNEAYGDKNMCDILFPKDKVAHNVLKNMNGYFYLEGKPVSEAEALSYCQNIDDVVIKPSMSFSGQGVQSLSVKDGKTNIDNLTIDQLFKKYDKNWLIQKKVKQHASMSALNPTSVNTMRILSYRSGMEVLIIYTVVRIGRKGQVIDNQCAGGISTTVTKDGKLGKYAFGGYSTDNVEKTDSGVVLDGYQLPSYDKAIAFVKELHGYLPFFNLVGWDVAIQENGEPILIEWNTKPGLSQSAFCSGMGENTERIIRELWPRKNTRHPNWPK
jgi:hypothetical protein